MQIRDLVPRLRKEGYRAILRHDQGNRPYIICWGQERPTAPGWQAQEIQQRTIPPGGKPRERRWHLRPASL